VTHLPPARLRHYRSRVGLIVLPVALAFGFVSGWLDLPLLAGLVVVLLVVLTGELLVRHLANSRA